MLALLLLVHHAVASDIPKDTRYVTRHITSCPDEGYFFRQEAAANAIDPLCFLCFCQDDGTAICWKRENRRCDLKSYQAGKKDTRVRRSPLSLGEIFVRDAAREFFNKQSPEQCKPYESSFSDGCPPVDWCTGCTVCDCDANGRWDCHILSFCPDKNGKKQMKKQKTPLRNRISRRRSKSKKSVPSQSTKNPPKRTTKKPVFKPNMRRNQVKQSRNQPKQSNVNKHKINPVKGTKVRKIAPVRKPKPKLQARKSIPNNTKVTKNPLIIKKDISTSQPLKINPSKVKVNQNNTVEVAQKVVRQFMSTVQKMMKNFEKKANSTSKQPSKVVNKRSTPKHESKRYAKSMENKHMFRAKHLSKAMVNKNQNNKKSSKKITYKQQNRKQNNNGRNKRQVAYNESITDLNFTNYYQDEANNRQDEENKTVSNFISNFTNKIPTTTVHANEIFAVYPIPLNMETEIIILDNKTSKENDIIINTGSTFNDVKNFTTPHYNNADTVNFTNLPALSINNFSISFENDNNTSYMVEDVSIITTDGPSLSTKSMPYTDRPELTDYEQGNNSKEEIIAKNDRNFTKITEQLEYKDINHTCKFRTLLEKLIGADENNITKTVKKPKRYTIMTKIKRLFKKIFHKSMKSKIYHSDNLHDDNFDPTQFDHKKIGHCKLHSKEKNKLRQKINLLRNESETILKTIRIIKGLLQILEISTNESAKVSKFKDSNDDIGKLDAIMKNNEEIVTKLSNDQRTQIRYIKENVHVFIKSMGNFATVLEDIIDIVKHHNTNHVKVTDTTMRNNVNYKLMNATKDNRDTTKEKLEKLKKMLLNYNILQNTFVHQIYTMLNNIESNVTAKNSLKPKIHSYSYPEYNKTDAIEANSENIIKNIRKLKVLAEKLNSRGRRKRDTIGDDDAIEYLLILMEYLLKRHAPPNSPPANDGIDLLIEAIKSAPDIEPIRKKVLEYVPDRTLVTRTASPTNSAKKDNTYYKSKPIQEENIVTTKKITTKTTKPTPANGDEEVDDYDYEKIYQKFKSFKDSSSQQKDDMLDQNIDSSTVKPFDGDEAKSARKSGSHELLTNKGIDDDIDSTTFTSTATAQLEITTEYPTTFRSKSKSNDNINDNFLVDAKANIDWIEENFKEVRRWKPVVDPVTTTLKTVTRTSRNKVKNTNLSDVTREIELDNKVINKSRGEVMTKKQKSLLNALDYAVEKELDDDVDSKEDKFISDTY
ncbi:uncharacterized protein [Epargyreus clarus]|uniref:uncharacterized protein n=1 Tax=Epargyreus clarus TaxID=520877 RepID=UPI003C2C2215